MCRNPRSHCHVLDWLARRALLVHVCRFALTAAALPYLEALAAGLLRLVEVEMVGCRQRTDAPEGVMVLLEHAKAARSLRRQDGAHLRSRQIVQS